MNEQEFNLLDEPWICVLTDDLKQKEVSLTDVFENAHTYRCLSGELRSQDAAILRLLLAVLHTVFSRYDVNGAPAPIKEYDDALERWQSLWELGHFPFEPIKRYLAEWKHRFWLFDPERPFYQVKAVGGFTKFEAYKLNGAISQSGHKSRLFSSYSGVEKTSLSYAQAARWLLSLMAFDDSAGKTTESKLEMNDGKKPAGVGWLGKIGTIYPVGDNLFCTIMLNLVLLRNGEDLWGEEKPVWELSEAAKQVRRRIPLPNNASELLTLQSRRIKLLREDDRVVGYWGIGGDSFPEANAFSEQMTMWRISKQHNEVSFMPKCHDTDKHLWREFSGITICDKEGRQPGVIAWLKKLREYGLLDSEMMLTVSTVTVTYQNNSSVDDVIADSIYFNTSLIEDASAPWQAMINKQILLCGELANAIEALRHDLYLAGGGDKDKIPHFAEMEQLYYMFDLPFRRWLSSLRPHSDDIIDAADAWSDTAYTLTDQLGRKIVEDSGTVAFTGREIKDKKKKTYYSAPQAYNTFKIEIFNLCKGV